MSSLHPFSLIPAAKSKIRSAIAPQFIALLSVFMAIGLSACTKPASKTEDIRPVRVVHAALQEGQIEAEYSGEIRPRIESRLGFRVPGKIIARKVELGTMVRKGQVLMQLDPQDLLLGQAQAKAGMTAAESNRDLAKAELKRYQELRAKNFVAQAVLDAKETAYQAAQASFEQAKAGFSNQTNQANYSTLVSDVDGVVTAIEAEVGQVVSAGTPVVRVAKSGDVDMVVGIPEDRINSIRQMKDVTVRLWANPKDVVVGKLRELSPIADPVTRTFTAKIELPDTMKNIRLGMTATVSFGMKNPLAMIRLPLTALFQEKNVSSVWVVDSGAVRLVPVQVGATVDEDVLIAAGIQPGQMIVTAGVNLLQQGQKVTILGEEVDPTSKKSSTSVSSASASATVAASGVAK